jgi:L-fuconolactonase
MVNRVIDSHQHFWQVGLFDYPWMNPELGVLYQSYLPPDVEAVLKECNVAETVLVQASNSLAETRWLLSLADQYSFIAGVVGWVDLMSDEVEGQLEEFAGHSKFKGVRHLVESEPREDWLIQSRVIKGLSLLAVQGISYDLLVHTRHLKHVRTLAETCPELSMTIDHLAKPPVASGEVDDWKKEIEPVAAYPNVSCKLSGLVTEANHRSWRTEDLRPYVDCVLQCFGPERLMFGSDWPVCLLAGSYRQVFESFQELLADLSAAEQKRIFGENAVNFYRLKGRANAA